MKPWLRLLIAVVILLAIVGVIYWPHKPVATAAAPPLVKLNSSDVRSVAIAQPGQPSVLVTKAGNDWTMTQPYTYPVDQSAVTGMLDTLANITGAQDIGPATQPAAFGLDHPAVVTLGLANGQSLTFNFGSDTPTGGNSYLQLGASNPSAPVEIVPSDVKQSALKSAFLLQDKSILHFPAGQLTGLDLTSAGKNLHLTQTNGQWPKDQQTNVQSLLDALNDGQMTAMPDPTGKDAAADGLAHPAITLTLTWNGGSATLDIGAKKGAAEYYARNSASPAIFTLSDYLVTDINNVITPPKTPAVTQ